MSVAIVPYQPKWPAVFQTIGTALRHALGDTARRIDHIGSTAVPGLAAKDRIDVQIAVEDLSSVGTLRSRSRRWVMKLGRRSLMIMSQQT